MSTIEDWWARGATVRLPLGGEIRSVFSVRLGEGPVRTLLHGFPSSSEDWAGVAAGLPGTLLLCDFLGFGASEKPREHAYSIHEQADLVQALWAHEHVGSTSLVAHDYAVSVAQELLARRAQGALEVELRSLTLLNGGVYPELHRPQPTQTALLDPVQGPQVSALINEELFVAGLAPTFAPGFDAGEASARMWRGVSREDGHRISHLLIRYIADRERHGGRWTKAMESTDVPLSFVWGLLDPVSGEHMAERIRERLPDAPLLELSDVSHWPMIEAPERVLAALRD